MKGEIQCLKGLEMDSANIRWQGLPWCALAMVFLLGWHGPIYAGDGIAVRSIYNVGPSSSLDLMDVHGWKLILLMEAHIGQEGCSTAFSDTTMDRSGVKERDRSVLGRQSLAVGDCNVLPTDVVQPGYAIYTKRVYNDFSDTILVVRDVSQLSERYADPANWAGNAVDNAPYAPITHVWTRDQFEGNDIMGIAIDPRTREIYVSTSLLNNSSPFPPPFSFTIDNKVYKISADGSTVTLFATIPGNKGSGWIDIDTTHNQIYVSNFDDGLIYTVDLAAGNNQTGPFASFSPFPADALNEVTTPMSPDWNMAPLGERIFSVGYNAVESRLYYSVWSNDIGENVAATSDYNTIRSVAIDNTGAFVSASDIEEIVLPELYLDFYSNPVSDIVFSADGTRMMVAEQGISSILGFAGFAHNSRVLEYTGLTNAWVAEPVEKFLIGTCCGGPYNHEGQDARGGVAFAPGAVIDGNTYGDEDWVITTADAVADNYTLPDHREWVDGAGFMPSSGSYNSLEVLGLDFDEIRTQPDKGSYGDIDVFVCSSTPVPFDLALVKTVNTGVTPGPFFLGDMVTFRITVYNQGTEYADNIRIRDEYPGSLSLSDANWIAVSSGIAERTLSGVNLAPGASTEVNITFSITASSGHIINYSEIVGFTDDMGNPATDADSDGYVGAFNDAYEQDNYLYGVLNDQDEDDLDPADIYLGVVGIGNVVFIDMDSDLLFSSNEGVENVKIYIYRPGYGADGVPGTPDDGFPLDSTMTDVNGEYSFTGLTPGEYFIEIPYTEFEAGGLLEGYKSIPGNGADNQVDDNSDENGLDVLSGVVNTPDLVGVRSQWIDLTPGEEPMGEEGFHGDQDNPDQDIDYTVDFGFFQTVGIGNLVWLDGDGNGVYNPGEEVGGVPLELYRPGYGPDGIAGTADDDLALDTTYTDDMGHYYFDNLLSGDYIVHIPAYVFANVGSSILAKATSIVGSGTDNGIDDDADENGQDVGIPEIDGVSSSLIHLEPGTEPISTETGSDADHDIDADANYDLTVDFGFTPLVGIGNLVWIDSDNDGHYTDGEGINGVLVELYQPGFGPDKIPGTSDDNDPVQSLYTFDFGAGPGMYFFADRPGTYEVVIPASQFQSGGPLFGYTSLGYFGADDQIDDDVDENGQYTLAPAVTGVHSTLITLSNYDEPVNESGFANIAVGPLDNSVDFTVDFGFRLLNCTVEIDAVTSTCNDNGTASNSTDDWFRLDVTASVTEGSGNYVVKIGGYTSAVTPSGTTVTIVGDGQGGNPSLMADGVSIYTVRVEDELDNTCFIEFTVGPVSPCSFCPTNNCKSIIISKD